MVGYVYYNSNNIIAWKGENIASIQFIQDGENEVIITNADGSNISGVSPYSASYIILAVDTPNLSVGQYLDVSGLVDMREVFLKTPADFEAEEIVEEQTLESELKALQDSIKAINTTEVSDKSEEDYMYNYLINNTSMLSMNTSMLSINSSLISINQ